MVATPTVEYRIIVDEDAQMPFGELTPRELLDFWIDQQSVTCCDILGGFVFQSDGEDWNAEAIDEVRMSRTWLQGVMRLFEGHSTSGVWAWEESRMTLVRRGELVEMFDVHYGGHIVCPMVVFPLRDLARALADEADLVGMMMDDVLELAETIATPEQLEVLENNLKFEWRKVADELRAAAGRPIPPPPGGDPGPPPALHLAIRLDDCEVFTESLRDEGPSIVYKGQRPLHLAIGLSRTWAVDDLLAAGADTDEVNERGLTPLLVACQRGDPEMIERLLSAGANPESRGSHEFTPVQQIALGVMRYERSVSSIELLLEAGAELDLVSAVAIGDIEAAERLSHQAPQFPDIFGLWVSRLRKETYMGLATVSERARAWRPALTAFAAAGATPDSPGDRWDPALHAAVLSEDLALVEEVLALGADPRHVARERSALELAERSGLEAIAARLRGKSV